MEAAPASAPVPDGNFLAKTAEYHLSLGKEWLPVSTLPPEPGWQSHVERIAECSEKMQRSHALDDLPGTAAHLAEMQHELGELAHLAGPGPVFSEIFQAVHNNN